MCDWLCSLVVSWELHFCEFNKGYFMSIKHHIFGALLFSMAMGSAMAGECLLQVTRTACPAQEKESFSKCDGKASCVENVPAASASQCASKA
ncbi:MAG TPA: hypothetical protein VEZ89_09630, partial [Rubrivivax sp.]|nr:hypothetical protein [Rubrivivax sp.]